MQTQIRVLHEDECAQVHHRSLRLLNETGVRVMSERARVILAGAGAAVEAAGERVRFPRALIEESLRLAPRRFKLGGRRPGWNLQMNGESCSLVADGGAVSVLDWKTGDVHPGTFDDWAASTCLIDALDEIGVYWTMVEDGFADTCAGFVEFCRALLKHCSKHIQDSVESVEKARLLLEVLGIAFGGRQDVRLNKPYSYILCPMSPLTIDRAYTDAYLVTTDWELPVAIMPMPLMGATAPASLLSTILLANAEFLAMLCLVQAAAPGTAVLYAPAPQVVETRTWKYTGGAIENGLLGAATADMGRYYGLPVEASTGGTDQFRPGAQAAYERAVNWALPTTSWPDLLVGPGLLGGSTILCLEQLMLDVEIFRRYARLHRGMSTAEDTWLDDVLREAGPGANFIGQKSTVWALRDGRFHRSEVGFHGTYEQWKAAGMPDVVEELPQLTQKILKEHQPLPLDPMIDRELKQLAQREKDAGR
jgi:trimethylamine--corrinoid protein Co-methyltransferase